MALGDVQQQNEKLAQFSQMAVGLGYDPREVESFSKLAAMGQASKATADEQKRQRDLADYKTKQAIDSNIPYNPATDATLQRELYLSKNAVAKPQNLKDLVDTRKSLSDAGLDTSAIDQEIAKLGVDTTKKTPSKGDVQAISLVDELLNRNTAPLTGAIQSGNADGVFGINPVGRFNKLFRPDIETTKAKVEQLKGLLQLAQAGKLKGSGQISDKEREMLAKAATSLNYNMSDADFKNELRNIRATLSGEPVSLGKNPKTSEVKLKLKSQGYSDADIAEYIKVKGLK